MLFFQKFSISRLPSDWPAYHNKCNNSRCHYPNAPQYIADRYLCGGRLNGAYCGGTVTVTSATARKATRQRRVEEDRKMKHDEKARQMRREEARRLWGQNGSRSQNPRVAIGRARPLSQSQRNCNVKSGKLIRRPQGYQKGDSFLEL
ncbi:hypothetical protein FIBSPDRAFT_930335 [Athelia psychrophila]|uniref:Uncharacterized protein n=1 Tax=Athelia psychrophila TaxID=1759441 RepID=A0A166MC85_9AGAM|nr:hypothetical protein FIBSPDRAFT_930335 [Fibularhizoctonia sp. CBS 109695]